MDNFVMEKANNSHFEMMQNPFQLIGKTLWFWLKNYLPAKTLAAFFDKCMNLQESITTWVTQKFTTWINFYWTMQPYVDEHQ